MSVSIDIPSKLRTLAFLQAQPGVEFSALQMMDMMGKPLVQINTLEKNIHYLIKDGKPLTSRRVDRDGTHYQLYSWPANVKPEPAPINYGRCTACGIHGFYSAPADRRPGADPDQRRCSACGMVYDVNDSGQK